MNPPENLPKALLPLITLTTDFGGRDPYVAVLKGVIRSICPHAQIEDWSHEIRPQALTEAALFMATAVPFWPSGTIHIAVIDPGVGTDRRALAVRAGGQVLIGPDNGVFSLVLQAFPSYEAREIANPDWRRPEISATFHGRDIFAPAAAHLALGEPFEAIGPEIGDLQTLSIPNPLPEAGMIHGEIIHVDHFGNCITNLSYSLLESGVPYRIHVAALTIPGIQSNYAAVPPGALTALFGSTGCLEIAVRNGSAHDIYHLNVGAPVTLYRP